MPRDLCLQKTVLPLIGTLKGNLLCTTLGNLFAMPPRAGFLVSQVELRKFLLKAVLIIKLEN